MSFEIRGVVLYTAGVALLALAGCGNEATTMPANPSTRPTDGGFKTGNVTGGDAGAAPEAVPAPGEPSEKDKLPDGGNATLPPITVD